MKGQARNIPLLKKILWADALLGGGTALIGLGWYPSLAVFLGLPAKLIVLVAAVTLAYAILAFRLARQRLPATRWLRVLVYANWGWTIISTILLILYIADATAWGTAFLILQVLVVGMLAYLEGRHTTGSRA